MSGEGAWVKNAFKPCQTCFPAAHLFEGHNPRIFAKLQEKSRTEAVARTGELGLLYLIPKQYSIQYFWFYRQRLSAAMITPIDSRGPTSTKSGLKGAWTLAGRIGSTA